MNGPLRGAMQVCLKALAQAPDKEIAALARQALALQEVSNAEPRSPSRLAAGSQYLSLIETLSLRGAFANFEGCQEFAGFALTSARWRRL